MLPTRRERGRGDGRHELHQNLPRTLVSKPPPIQAAWCRVDDGIYSGTTTAHGGVLGGSTARSCRHSFWVMPGQLLPPPHTSTLSRAAYVRHPLPISLTSPALQVRIRPCRRSIGRPGLLRRSQAKPGASLATA